MKDFVTAFHTFCVLKGVDSLFMTSLARAIFSEGYSYVRQLAHEYNEYVRLEQEAHEIYVESGDELRYHDREYYARCAEVQLEYFHEWLWDRWEYEICYEADMARNEDRIFEHDDGNTPRRLKMSPPFSEGRWWSSNRYACRKVKASGRSGHKRVLRKQHRETVRHMFE